MPQPKVCAKKTMKLIGTNRIARSFDLPSRPSRSHSPNATNASAIDSAKLTKPNMNGCPNASGSANATVGGRRLWTSRATHSIPATVSGGIIITTSLVASSTPTSLASGIASTSTPRLPIGSQRKLYHCDR